ncbi:MAG: hypothetical protein OCC45_00500 [Desulfotalea sp.]
MNINIYTLKACPRCWLAYKYITSLQDEFPEMKLTRIDALLHPIYAYKQGVRMIPALQGKEHLSGVTLSKEKIRQFLQREKELQTD